MAIVACDLASYVRSYAAHVIFTHKRRCAVVMKTTLMVHLSSLHIRRVLNTNAVPVGRSFRPSGGSYAPGSDYLYNLSIYYIIIGIGPEFTLSGLAKLF